MNWNQNLVTLAQDAGDSQLVTDDDFLAQLPRIVKAAELQILRDLDLINTIISDDSGSLDAGRQRFVLPKTNGIFVVPMSVQLVIGGVRRAPLDWISIEAFPHVWPGIGPVGSPSIPRNVAPYDGTSLLVGPAPDQSYQAYVTGTQRPLSLENGVIIVDDVVSITPGSPADTGTFISTELQDLFRAAEMIEVSAWQRQFSPQADEAGAPVTWAARYEKLKTGAFIEEARKKLQSFGYGSRIATPAQMVKG